MSLSTEDQIYDHQYEVIKAKYGKEEADKANYGWGVNEVSETEIFVETKVYGPWKCLVTDETMEDFWFDLAPR